MRRMFVCVLATLLGLSAVIVGPDPSAAVTPGGIGRIVFASTMDDLNGEIYIRDFSGGGLIRFTNNTAIDDDPAWSPDGSKIAYTTDINSNLDVFVLNVDGTGLYNLTSNAPDDRRPAWSPDGSKIAFESYRDGNWEVYVMNADDGSSPTNLSGNAFYDGEPAWSPDGSKIAFTSDRDGNYEVYVMNLDGKGRVNLSNTASVDEEPAWSPDGSKIAFTSNRDGNDEIYVMSADGTDQTRLTNDPGWDNQPAWSPDGSKIAFTSTRDGNQEVYMMNPDGTDAAPLTTNPAHEYSIDWEAVNRPPVARNDTTTVPRGGSVTIEALANDSDPDGDRVRLDSIVTPPTHGTITNKWVTSFVYAHDGSASTIDTFTYRINDGLDASALTDTATVTIAIKSTDPGPDPDPTPTHPRFVDVPATHLFYADVEWLASEGITKGCNPPINDHYCPDANVTRGQMAAFLVRALGYTDDGGGDLFVDDDSSIFEADIDRLGTAGVTKGCNPPANTHYCPDAYVTRGQMAAFLVRAMGYTDNGGGDLFTDDNDSIFEGDIDRLGTAGVTKGCNPPTNTHYCPDAHVTRAQMAAFLHRALG
ncbi:MAG: Ig-like domain-containing protein [Actinomycetota bacterium]|nr:Ig-like domain-containing protein [Actinomycetota bacterium]